MSGTLFIVATPIGNLEDITLRALRVLKEADLIAAEDTRQTRVLLNHFGISTPLTSYFEHNEREKAPELIEKLRQGSSIALVSEAGTPGISDPGYRLVKAAVESSIAIVPVPGPSAVISLLSASGLPIDEFTFKGFVPSAASQRKKFLLELRAPERTFVMYESARRIEETVAAVLELLGDAQMIIGREMTKLHEEIMRGTASELLEGLKNRELKGEVTVIVRTAKARDEAATPAGEIEKLLKSGFQLKEVVKAVAQEFDLPKSDVYREALKVKQGLGQK